MLAGELLSARFSNHSSLSELATGRGRPHPPCADGERDGELVDCKTKLPRPHPARSGW
jgi:hypothetical protein